MATNLQPTALRLEEQFRRLRLKQKMEPKAPNIFPPVVGDQKLKSTESSVSSPPQLTQSLSVVRLNPPSDGMTAVNTMEYDKSAQNAQCEGIRTALNSKKCTDVTFLIGKDRTEFNLNRIFLAMISPIFKSMLYGQMREAQLDTDVIIEDMTPTVFECIVHFAYCADPQITSKNVLSVLTVCDKYLITKLQDVCYQFLKSDLKDSSFLSYYQAAAAMAVRA